MATYRALKVQVLLISPELRKPPSPGHPVHVGTWSGTFCSWQTPAAQSPRTIARVRGLSMGLLLRFAHLASAEDAATIDPHAHSLIEAGNIASGDFVGDWELGEGGFDGVVDGGTDSVDDPRLSLLGFHHSGVPQSLQVGAEGGGADFEGVYEFADAELGLDESMKDPDPGGVGEGFSEEYEVSHVGISGYAEIIPMCLGLAEGWTGYSPKLSRMALAR